MKNHADALIFFASSQQSRSEMRVNMDQKKIDRINELYKKQKAGTMTPEEKEEQSALRAEYIAAVRNNLRATLEHTSIQEPDGTIHKLRKKDTH